MADSGEEQRTLEDQFKSFAKFGDAKSTGESITLSNVDKWFKQAKVIDGKKVTTVDTGIYFKQIAKTKRAISYQEFNEFVEKIAKSKKLETSDIQQKLVSTGPPGTTGTTSVIKSSAVDRLTDTSKYTGSHKLRFDDSGKGKGKKGREDSAKGSGYVHGYKDEGAYENKVPSPQ